jgi:acetyl esterase/lipase
MKTFRRLAPVVAGLALLASSAGCGWPAGTRYVHQVFDDVQVTEDIVYRTTTNYLGEPVDLALDIYEPVGDAATQRPVVMWMHGGCWTFGDKGLMSAYAEDSALRGYVAVSINYRLRDTCSLEAANDAFEDSVAAVAWLEAHAAQYRLDPDAIVVGGHSAGAINAAHVLYQANPSPAAGGVVMAGLSFAAPTAGDPPVIMHQGTADTTVSPELAQTTCDSTVDVGNVCVFYSYEGQGHLVPYQEPYATQIKDRTATAIFEEILIPLGYEAEQL